MAPEDDRTHRRERISLYIILCVVALLVLMALANTWRMQAFKRRTAASAQDLPVLTQELRYHMPDAGEVFLAWGIDGWNPVPESLRPADTHIDEKGTMLTRMIREGDVFAVTIQSPANVTVAYGFLITADRAGNPIPAVWDSDPDYQFFSVLNRTFDIEPSVTLEGE
jgi:hypothetical protein